MSITLAQQQTGCAFVALGRLQRRNISASRLREHAALVCPRVCSAYAVVGRWLGSELPLGGCPRCVHATVHIQFGSNVRRRLHFHGPDAQGSDGHRGVHGWHYD